MISFPQKISALALCCLCGAISVSARPRDARDFSEIEAASQIQTAQLQSVSGRISSVEGNTFTLKTMQSEAAASHEREEKVMTFTVDQNTTVEGRIEVGSNADVTYRKADGNNIAVSIRVTPQSEAAECCRCAPCCSATQSAGRLPGAFLAPLHAYSSKSLPTA
jgi:hypothetical protein